MHKILIADDHTISRAGLKMLLYRAAPALVFQEVKTAHEALHAALHNEFDLVIMDVNMPGGGTAECVRKILRQKPTLYIIMYSMNTEPVYEKKFLLAGARKYVCKNAPENVIKEAVLEALQEVKTLAENGPQQLQPVKIRSLFDELSPRQKEITRLMMEGKTVKEICVILNLHSSTVSTQKMRIFQKLQIQSVVDLYTLSKMAS